MQNKSRDSPSYHHILLLMVTCVISLFYEVSDEGC